MNTPATGSRHTDTLARILLVLAVAGFFWEVTTFAGALFHFDLIGFNAPVRNFFFGHLAKGTAPLWCPDVCGGFPLFAEGQLGPFYPPNLLFAVLPAWAAINLSVLLHALLAALGMFSYLRRSHSTGAAMVGSVFYTFSSYLVFHLIHLMLFQSACLLPFMFYFFDRYCTDGRISDILCTGLVLGLMFTTGHQQGPILGAMGLCVFAASLALESFLSGNKRQAVSTLGSVLLVGTITALVSSVIIYGILELVSHSVRQEAVASSFLYSGSLTPEFLVRLASPFHHGRIMENTWLLPDHSEKEIAVYLGLAAFLLVPLVLFTKPGRRERAHLAIMAFGFLYILGNAGPFSGLVEYIPVLNRTRIPARFILPMTLSASFLVASGLDALRVGKLSVKKTGFVLAGGTLVWVLVAWGGGFLAYGGSLFVGISGDATPQVLGLVTALKTDLTYRSLLALGLIVCLIALAKSANTSGVKTGAIFFAISFLVFADLSLSGQKENPTITPDAYGPFATTHFLKQHLGVQHRMHSLDNHVPYGHGGWVKGTESFRYGIEALPHSTPLLFGINSADCGSPLVLGRTDKVYGSLTMQWLRQLSVKFLLSRNEMNLPLALDTGRVKTFAVPAPAPLYSLAGKVLTVEGPEEAFAATGRLTQDVTQTAYVEGDVPHIPDQEGSTPGKISILLHEPDHRILAVDSENPSFLVVRENYYPGWSVEVDGKPSKLYRTNYLFYGLQVPEGRHEVVLTYKPSWFAPLLVLSLVSFFGILAASILSGFLKKQRPSCIHAEESPVSGGKMLRLLLIVFVLLLAVAVLRHPQMWNLFAHMPVK